MEGLEHDIDNSVIFFYWCFYGFHTYLTFNGFIIFPDAVGLPTKGATALDQEGRS